LHRVLNRLEATKRTEREQIKIKPMAANAPS